MRKARIGGAAHFLTLAAAPTFALMALLTAGLEAGPMLCGVAHQTSPLSGMAVMYALMAAFHLPPWLKLVISRRHVPAPPESAPA